MAGTALKYDLSAIGRLARSIEQLEHLNTLELFDTVGATLESQTRRRILEDKTGPDGTAWPDWSDGYKKTRHANQSLLIGEGDQLDSLTYQLFLDGSGIEYGSNLIYFATHDLGDEDRGIPQRQMLGLSPENEDELADVIDDWLKGAVNL